MTFVGVCGGRKYADNLTVERVIVDLRRKHGAGLVIVEGGAPGADRLANQAAVNIGIQVITVHALWNYYGKAAGMRRNAVTAEVLLRLRAEELIAFPGDVGTRGMCDLARAKGIPVVEIAP